MSDAGRSALDVCHLPPQTLEKWNVQTPPSTSLCYSPEELRKIGVKAVMAVTEKAQGFLEERQSAALSDIRIPEEDKSAIGADYLLERLFKNILQEYPAIVAGGEESLREFQRQLEQNRDLTFALVDALDGSDLFQRKFGNWCCAAAFFHPTSPPGSQTKAAMVAIPTEQTRMALSATIESPGIQIHRIDSSGETTVAVPQQEEWGPRRLLDAAICFVGQKLDSFAPVAESGLIQYLRQRREEDLAARNRQGAPLEKERFRIYNLGGIPMVIRLIEGRLDELNGFRGRGVDAIVEARGQKAHDIVPGAFLASRFGVTILNLEGTILTPEELEFACNHPRSETVRYVMASNRDLGMEICAALRGV